MENKFICPWCKGSCSKSETAEVVFLDGQKLVSATKNKILCYWCVFLVSRGYKDRFFDRKRKFVGQNTSGKAQDWSIVKKQSPFWESFDSVEDYLKFTDELYKKWEERDNV